MAMKEPSKTMGYKPMKKEEKGIEMPREKADSKMMKKGKMKKDCR